MTSPQIRVLVVLLCGALWSCPGSELNLPKDGTTPQWPDTATGADTGLVWPDTVKVNLDGTTTKDGPSAGDLAQGSDAQVMNPDAKIYLDAGIPGVGKPCPCKAPLLCVSGICRAQCNPPTDPCKVVSNCPATEGCVQYAGGPNYVCVPALGPGQSCATANAFCAVNLVCGSYNSGPFQCVPVCSPKGGACGTGGTCLDDNGCLFCSHP